MSPTGTRHRTAPATAVRLVVGAALTLGLGVGTLPLQATTAHAAVVTPSSFTAVTSTPGPGPGEVTISWTQDGRNTTGYVIETGLTSFSYTDASMPMHARGSRLFTVPAGRRSVTLTAAQTASAGAGMSSANHLYFRLRAVNLTASGETVRYYPYLQTVAVAPAVPAPTGTPLRVGTFNVRTSRATDDVRTWLDRAPDVARSIVEKNLGVVALQELGPGRADGVEGSTGGRPRQTDSLLTTLAAQGASRYKLIRTTPYVKAGTVANTQGMRILYDASRYTLVSNCLDTSSDGAYSASCSVKLPIRNSDTEAMRRRATYAEFADKGTGEHFYFVSVHFDSRRSTDLAVERTYDLLRGSQAKAAVDAVDAVNTQHLPVILGGDINTWQNNKVGYTAHDVLVDEGFYDTAAADRQVNVRYTTMNDFQTTLSDPGTGFGSRLDALMVKGISSADYWENVMKVTDTARPSDHNMVIADIRLPGVPGGSTQPVSTPTAYEPVTPTRITDTRTGNTPTPLGAGGTLDVAVTGRAGVPSTGVGAVVLNLTATGRGGGYLTAYPSGEARTTASTLNYTSGRTVANNVVVKVGSNGRVRLYGSGTVDVAVDVQGWFPTGSDYTALTPARLLDTRSGTGTTGGQPAAGTRLDLVVTGRGGVPVSGVGAVVLNVTATGSAAAGNLVVYPAGVSRPTASSLNFVPGRSVANGVVVKVGAGGKVSLWTTTATHVVADVQGWFPTGSDLTALTPSRLLDTRSGNGAVTGTLQTGRQLDLVVAGRGGVPVSGVTAVVLNVTATKSEAAGFVTVVGTGDGRTGATNLALEPGRSVATQVIVKVGSGGKVTLTSTANTHLVADVVAYLRG